MLLLVTFIVDYFNLMINSREYFDNSFQFMLPYILCILINVVLHVIRMKANGVSKILNVEILVVLTDLEYDK